MCGINGIIGNANDKTSLIQEMNDRIIHRGPDSEGYYIDDKVIKKAVGTYPSAVYLRWIDMYFKN